MSTVLSLLTNSEPSHQPGRQFTITKTDSYHVLLLCLSSHTGLSFPETQAALTLLRDFAMGYFFWLALTSLFYRELASSYPLRCVSNATSSDTFLIT